MLNKIVFELMNILDDILNKIPNIGKKLDKFSLETVKMFFNDAVSSDFSIKIENQKL